MLTMTESPYLEGTLSPEHLAFKPVPKPSLADMQAIPDNAHVVIISWPDTPPEIIGVLFDPTTRQEFQAMFDGDENARAGDVFMFYVAPIQEEDALVRHVMDLPKDKELSALDSAIPVYSEQDVVEMIRVAARLAASPTPF